MLNCIRTVIREFHWSPDYVAGLFLDEADEFGLLFWYEDIREMNKPQPQT